MAKPLILEVSITTTRELFVLRPYLQQYGTPSQIALLEEGFAIKLQVPDAAAALQIWDYVFTHMNPEDLDKLSVILTAKGIPLPPTEFTSKTDIKWLRCDTPGYLNPLRRGDIFTIGELTTTPRDVLLDMRDVSETMLEKVAECLKPHGVTLLD